MIQRTVKSLFQLLGTLVVGLLIVLPVVAWRLSSGPIVLDILKPTIEKVLAAEDGSFSVTLDSTVLALGEGSRMLELRALGVTAYSGSSAPIATVPELALTLNGRALMRGQLVPNSVTLYRPKVRLVREIDGSLRWAIGEQPTEDNLSADEVVRALIDALVGVPNRNRPGRLFQRAAIVDADLMVEDRALDLSWHAPDADILMRRTGDGLAAQAKLDLDLGGEKGSVAASIRYRRDDNGVEGDLRIEGLRPALLARLGGALAPLSALDMPLKGTVQAKGDASGHVAELSLDLSGGVGRMTVPGPMGITHAVSSAALRARVFDDFTRAQLDELHLDLGGPTLTLAATADGLGGESVVKAEATLREVPFDSLRVLWPEALVPDARSWVVGNMSRGIAHEARAMVSLRSPSGRFDDVVVEHLSGEMFGDGVTVDYLRPMTPVRNAAAHATFDAKALRINAKGGEVAGLRVTDGLIVLGGLDQVDQWADIDLTIAGPA
ncbi:MAG: DUF3971 domain-containing protein, partial [Magnetospirillum sp.]|nr:DUF3971 domain-containing protein [Magnetospirillum sp.]